MADLFIVKERLKFSLKLTSVGIVLGLLATWYFYGQIEFETDRNRYLLSAVITGALMLAWVGLLLFYWSAKRVVDPAHSFTDRFDSIPWWIVKVLFILLVIGGSAFFIFHYGDKAETEFDLIRIGHLQPLEERIRTNPELLEQKDPDGRTVLEFAYQMNYPDAVTILIDNGADVVELASGGGNPIIASLRNLPMLGALLDCGFNPELPDAEGIPPVHHAVASGLPDALSLLLDADANVDGRDRISRTPLMRAVEMDAIPTAELLIEKGADLDAFDQRGDTALHIAVRRRNPDTVRLLLDNGADPKVFNFIHMTPLHLAAQNGQDELASIFLELPDMTELYDDADLTPLDRALQTRKYDTAMLLIENGADIDRLFIHGQTRLHKMILAKDYRTARFLIREGADATIPDKDGRTAIDIIRAKQLSGLLDLIEARDNPEAATNSVGSAIAP